MCNMRMIALRARDDIKGPARALLMALTDRADSQGTCWPSIATLAVESGLGISTVKKHLDYLRGRHLVSWEHRFTKLGDKDSNLYTVHISPVRSNQPSPAQDSPRSSSGGLRVGRDVANGQSPTGYKSPIETSAGSKTEAPTDSNSAPSGTAFLDADTYLSKEEAFQMARELHEANRYNSDSYFGIFTSQEIRSYASDWYNRCEENDWTVKGKRMKDPRKALRSWLESCAKNQSKRCKEFRVETPTDDDEPVF